MATIDNINIIKVETKLERDSNLIDHFSTTVIRLDPGERDLHVVQRIADGSTLMTVWHGREYEWTTDLHPHENVMQRFLSHNLELFARICDGYTCEWVGCNLVGHLSADAIDASEQIDAALEYLQYECTCVNDCYDYEDEGGYLIDYCTLVDGDLDEAKTAADAGTAYTQRDIVIHDTHDNEVSRRTRTATSSALAMPATTASGKTLNLPLPRRQAKTGKKGAYMDATWIIDAWFESHREDEIEDELLTGPMQDVHVDSDAEAAAQDILDAQYTIDFSELAAELDAEADAEKDWSEMHSSAYWM